MSINFIKSEYIASHWKEPKGRGNWAFQLEGWNNPFFAPSDLTLREAKKIAADEQRKTHQDANIIILP